MPIVGQRRDRDVGDVVGVDERLGRVSGRERDLAAQDLLAPVVLAEVLGEPGRAQDRQLGAGVAHGPLAALGLWLAAPGQQDQPPDPLCDGQLGERTDRLRRARKRVQVVRDVGRSDPFQHRAPGRAVLPVEGGLAGARADANGKPRAASRSATRRPVFDVPPSTSVGSCLVLSFMGPQCLGEVAGIDSDCLWLRAPIHARTSRAAAPDAGDAAPREPGERGEDDALQPGGNAPWWAIVASIWSWDATRPVLRVDAERSMTKTRESMLDRPTRWTIKSRPCILGVMDAPDPFPPADPFGEALHFLRMTGAYYCRSELTAPWGLTLPPMPGYMWFHVVTSGRMWLETGEKERDWIQLGDLALVPHGEGHVLRSEPGAPAPGILDLEREARQRSLRDPSPRRGRRAHRPDLRGRALRAPGRRQPHRDPAEHDPRRGVQLAPAGVDAEHAAADRLRGLRAPARRRDRDHAPRGHPRDPGDPGVDGERSGRAEGLAGSAPGPPDRPRHLKRSSRPRSGLDRRLAGPRAVDVALGVRGPLHRARRRAGDELRRPLAHAGRGQRR